MQPRQIQKQLREHKVPVTIKSSITLLLKIEWRMRSVRAGTKVGKDTSQMLTPRKRAGWVAGSRRQQWRWGGHMFPNNTVHSLPCWNVRAWPPTYCPQSHYVHGPVVWAAIPCVQWHIKEMNWLGRVHLLKDTAAPATPFSIVGHDLNLVSLLKSAQVWGDCLVLTKLVRDSLVNQTSVDWLVPLEDVPLWGCPHLGTLLAPNFLIFHQRKSPYVLMSMSSSPFPLKLNYLINC